MPQEKAQADVRRNTQQLLEGPLKHVKAAALAAALMPLASITASPAMAQNCTSGGKAIGDYVWQDTNANGIQDAGEPAVEGAILTLSGDSLSSPLMYVTDATGLYIFSGLCNGTYVLTVIGPSGMQPSPPLQGGDPAFDSDGVADAFGNSLATVEITELTVAEELVLNVDFGFRTPEVAQPGTAGQGYWKNHPQAWPVESIDIGGRSYSRDQAIAVLGKTGGDKTITMFSSLLAAKLNVMVGNDASCIATAIAVADQWIATYPVGSNVKASSVAWRLREPWLRLLENYNDGILCAPQKD